MKLRHLQNFTLRFGTQRGVVKIGFGAVMLALVFSLAGFGPAQAQPDEVPVDASGVVAAQIDLGDFESAVEAFDSGDAEAAAELAAIVAPQTGVDFDDSELVSLSSDGELVLEDETGLSMGLSFKGSTVAPEIVGGAAVATGVDTDLDVVSRATSDGAQIVAVLGSKDAPNEIPFNLDLPAGATLAPQADGSILIVVPVEDERAEAAIPEVLLDNVSAEGQSGELTDEQIELIAAIPEIKTEEVIQSQPIAEIESPWAVDADGNPIETHFELDGDALTQVIEINGETVFPVVADPTVTASVWQIGTCVGAIGYLLVSTYLSAAKILKIKKYIKSAGGVKTAVQKMMKSYEKYKKAVKKAKAKNKKPPKLRDFMSKDLRNTSAALGALVSEILAINSVRKACFEW